LLFIWKLRFSQIIFGSGARVEENPAVLSEQLQFCLLVRVLSNKKWVSFG
jgi:hypothetical protein